jgi:effector-binding domain-containing protein
MKALKILCIILLALVAVILILGLIAPKSYKVERTVSIEAPKSLVFRHIQYWKNWQAWSPWAEMDSTVKITLEGVDGTEGSAYGWMGKKTGEGIMTNAGVKPAETLYYRMRFIKPWKSEADGYVGVAGADGGTAVTWGFTGRTPYPWNAINLFMNMEKMLGGDFEKGLALLKDICEKETVLVRQYRIRTLPFPAKTFAVIRKTLTMDGMREFFGRSFPKLMETLGRNGIRPAGAPCALYFSFDEKTGMNDMAAAVPVTDGKNLGDVKIIRVPGSRACAVDHFGPYDRLVLAYDALSLYMEQNNLKPKMPAVEEYLSDPMIEKDPSKWLTKVYFFTE